MNTLRTAIRSLKRTEAAWRFVSNLGPTLSFAANTTEKLTDTERDLVARLNEDGIATTAITSLVAPSLFDELCRLAAGLLEKKSDQTAELAMNAAKGGAIGKKTFNLEMLGSVLTFDVEDSFARFALNDSFLRIANAYFGMIARLRYYNVWYTAASNSTARESQLWHYDREDNYILKMFLYLDEVDEGTGPFTYAPGTHKKGKYRSIQPEYFLEGGVRRTTDEQMRAVFSEEMWVRAVGKKGTIVFADTRGYHKGGEARTRDRLMFTCMYTSPASESKRLIVFPNDLDLCALTSQQRRALQYK